MEPRKLSAQQVTDLRISAITWTIGMLLAYLPEARRAIEFNLDGPGDYPGRLLAERLSDAEIDVVIATVRSCLAATPRAAGSEERGQPDRPG